MDVPVIILNWNGWDDTLECLRSLRENPEVDQVWLVDNGSFSDRGGDAIAVYPGLRILRWDQNYGYAGGYNRALKVAVQEGFEFAYLLNNDAIVTRNFLSPVVRAARGNDNLAAIGSRVLYADPADSVEFDGVIHPPGVRPVRNESGTRLVRMVLGAGMLVRLQTMEEFGYFDDRFFCYCEEAEWCFRVRDHGLACAYCADSIIIHKGRKSDRNANTTYYMFRNYFLLFERLNETARKAETRRLLYEAACVAESARRSGNFQEWMAIAMALHDGLLGKFGKRPDRSAKAIPALRLACLSLSAHVHDKWQSLRGNQPGYGKPLRLNSRDRDFPVASTLESCLTAEDQQSVSERVVKSDERLPVLH
jgi:GT2 family glycosyltransferase